MKKVKLDFPIYSFETTYEKQIEKLNEELKEFLDEMKVGGEVTRVLHELQDLVQVIFHTVFLIVKEAHPEVDDEFASVIASNLIKNSNTQHVKKLVKYARERGWK